MCRAATANGFGLLAGLWLCIASVLADAPAVNLGHFNKLALNGYDVMTYWKGGKPKEGNPDISAEYNGAKWVFVSQANRETFLKNPARYAPQYGGYCAYAAAQNAVADVDPYTWRIWKDKLYLNYSPRVRRQWASDIDANIEKADTYWPGLLKTQ